MMKALVTDGLAALLRKEGGGGVIFKCNSAMYTESLVAQNTFKCNSAMYTACLAV